MKSTVRANAILAEALAAVNQPEALRFLAVASNVFAPAGAT